ncbi:MAG TPA: CHAT domain-containing tetratricopeptide repeat protein [Candidatus Angelobacter sp.]|nr:CHAT domain-containing tetratricopeptide repeat protein [Candidatus Angelobacter sp.]
MANSPKPAACVTVDVADGEALQVVADSPVDIALYVSGEGREFHLNGFEFGQETVTLSAAGQYHIEIKPTGETPRNAPLSVSMSLKALPLQAAASWQKAELAATQAKEIEIKAKETKEIKEAKQSQKIEAYTASLKLWQALGQQSAEARTLLMLGDATDNLKDLKGAREDYERALEICRANADLRCAAEAANNSGSTAQDLGQIEEAFLRLREAGEDWQKLSLLKEAGQTFSNLGILYRQTADFEKALSTYQHARVLIRNRSSLAYAKVLNNLGLCYLDLAQYDQAQRYFRKVIHAETGIKGLEDDLIVTRMNFGRSFMLEDNFHNALPLLESAAAQAGSRPNKYNRADTLNNLGQLLWHLKRLSAAKSRLESARDLDFAIGNKRGEAAALHYLGLIAQKYGNVVEARSLLDRALHIRLESKLSDDAADSLYERAKLELDDGKVEEAKDFGNQAIPLLETIRSHVPGAALRASFYARRRDLLELFVSIAMRPENNNATIDGLIAVERGRGRALLDRLAERRLYLPKPAEPSERRDGTGSEIDMDRHEPGARSLTSVSDLQRALSPQHAILEYQLNKDVSYVWLVRDREIKVSKLPSRAFIEHQVAAVTGLFGNILERQRDPVKQAAFQEALQQLSHTLLGPFKAEKLPSSLILVLDGDLYRVPFAALRLGGNYLGLQHDLMQAPSAAFLLQGNPPRPASTFSKSVLALYDPIFSTDDPRFPPQLRKSKDFGNKHYARLPFNEELTTIQENVPSARYEFKRGEDANIQTLLKLPLEQYGILYFSTHAFIDDQTPEQSSIALSVIDDRHKRVNPFLYPYQMADLHLNGSVVVLSACDTALGKKVLGEGMMGFAGSLFSAGASQLVLTLSDVDAESSSSFLSDIYKNLLGPNATSLEHALTLARRSSVNSKRWSDPYYWATYVAMGSPTHSSQSAKGKS